MSTAAPVHHAGHPPSLDARIVGLDALPDPTALEGLARRIFGEGDRPRGWFARKLRRERVVPALSAVAIRADAAPSDPRGWLGYVLVGAPPSLGKTARTSGTGVIPEARGHGLATRLLESVAERSTMTGLQRLELWAEAEVSPFYLARGFRLRHRMVTVVGFAHAHAEPRLQARAPATWRPRRADEHEPVAWLPEAWAGTEAAARHRCAFTEGTHEVEAWLSREGAAWLVQRLLTRGSLPAAADGLRRYLPPGAPVLLPWLPADAAATRALLEAGWAAAQHGHRLERLLPAR